jgi:hypothetical protein
MFHFRFSKTQPLLLILNPESSANVCNARRKKLRPLSAADFQEADLDEVALAFGVAPQTLRVW